MSSRPSRAEPSAQALVGPLEYDCLAVIWRRGAASVSQVLAELNSARSTEQQLAYTTVMTVLARLHEKKILSRMKEGRGYIYEPLVSEHELVERLGRKEIDELLTRYGRVAVAQFASAVRNLSPAHLAELRALVTDDEGDDN